MTANRVILALTRVVWIEAFVPSGAAATLLESCDGAATLLETNTGETSLSRLGGDCAACALRRSTSVRTA